jgi:hypothetical protein
MLAITGNINVGDIEEVIPRYSDGVLMGDTGLAYYLEEK